MNVLLLGPIHHKLAFIKQKGNLPFLRYQGQQSWVNAMEELGHKVFVFHYTDGQFLPNIFDAYISDFAFKKLPRLFSKYNRLLDRYYEYIPQNFFRSKKLLRLTLTKKFDIIIISGGINNVYSKTIAELKKKSGAKVLLFSGINPTYAKTKVEDKLIKKGIVDCVIENDEGYAKSWEEYGAKQVLVLPISATDPQIHKKLTLSMEEKNLYSSDICFVGTLTKKRQQILEKLTGYNIKIWGNIPPGVQLSNSLFSFYQGEARGVTLTKIFNACKIALNLQPADMAKGGNMRTFEIPGCGAFQLVDKVPPAYFIDGKEIIVFSSTSDLHKKIKIYLQNEKKRETIGEAGYKRAHKEHLYTNRFRKLFSFVAML